MPAICGSLSAKAPELYVSMPCHAGAVPPPVAAVDTAQTRDGSQSYHQAQLDRLAMMAPLTEYVPLLGTRGVRRCKGFLRRLMYMSG